MTPDPRAQLDVRFRTDRRVRWVAQVIAWIIGGAVTLAAMEWLGEWPGALGGWVAGFALGAVGRPWIVWAATRIVDRHDR